MAKQDEFFEKGFELIEFYRQHPCIAAYDLLGVELAPIQRLVLRDIWFKNYTILVASRGYGKTFVLGLASALQALLYPGQRVGLISGTFRQAKKIFAEVEKFYTRSYIFQEAVAKGPTHGSDSYRMEFKNVNGFSSFIEALPLGDGSKIRGSRFYFIVVDELAQVDATVLDTVIRPMAATARDPMERAKRYQRNKELYKAGLISKEELEGGNQDSVNRLVYASSGYFKFNHMWNRMCYFWSKIEEAQEQSKTPKHAVWQIPYWDLPEAFLESDIIEESKNEMSDIEFRMEYCAEMVKDSEGFFKASLLESCVSDQCDIELQGEAGREYVLGVDPNQGGSDNCGLVVIKLDPDVNKIVHIRNLNAKETKNIASAIKKICRNFNIVRIFIDKGGGGTNVSEWLAEDTNDGTPILTYEIEHHRSMNGKLLVHLINFTPSWISDSNFSLASMMESNKLVFPGMPKDNKVDVENIYDNTHELKTQLLNIVVTSNKQGTLHFDTPKKNQHKDLYSALLLASYGIKALEIEGQEPQEVLHAGSGLIRPRNSGSRWNVVGPDGETPDHLKNTVHAAVLDKSKRKNK